MILYHFTSAERMDMIWRDGFIRTTESNIGSPWPDSPPYGEHVGPDVVWLTDVEASSAVALGVGSGVRGLNSLDGTNKREVRVTVDVPDVDVTWWPDFARAHGMNPKWRRRFEHGDPESRWIVCRPIHMPEVVNLWSSRAGRVKRQ